MPPSLVAMLPELTELVDAGKMASKARDEVKLKIRQFREIGERRQFIDHVNAIRKELFGSLAKHALETPGLPADFADRFFKPSESGGDEAPEETVDSLAAEVKMLEDLLLAKKQRLAELVKAAEEEAVREKQKAEKLAQLNALNLEIEEKKKAAQALLDSLDD